MRNKKDLELELRRCQMALSCQAYGVVLMSQDDRVELVNQVFCDMFGLSAGPDELVGLTSGNILRLLEPAYADPEETFIRICNALSAGCHHIGEEALLADGRVLLMDFVPILIEGKPCGRMWQHRDITESRRAEKELQQSEEKFSKTFQTSPYAITITRLDDGRFLEVNDAFVAMTGYSRAEAVADSSIGLKMWVNEKDREWVVSAIGKGKPVVGREFLFRTKSGEVMTGLFSTQVIQLSQGPCILSSIDDITSRKRTEEDLRKNHCFLSDLIEYSGALIYVKDRDYRYELINRKWEEVTGLNRKDSIGKTDEELFPEHVVRQFRLNDLEVLESGLVLEKEETFEGVHGKRFFLSVKFPLRGADGEIEGICAMSADITARKQAEEKILYLATHDVLTDLPSLRLAKDRLAIALGLARRHNNQSAVMFIDLDNFKAVNDTLGHDAGDYVLTIVADRLLSCVRETDTVARVGGDEFLIIAGDLHSADNAGEIAEKVISLLSRPIEVNGRHTTVGVSIGIALYPDNGEDMYHLIKLADQAMYRIKNSGGNGYCFAKNELQ